MQRFVLTGEGGKSFQAYEPVVVAYTGTRLYVKKAAAGEEADGQTVQAFSTPTVGYCDLKGKQFNLRVSESVKAGDLLEADGAGNYRKLTTGARLAKALVDADLPSGGKYVDCTGFVYGY